MLDDLNRIGPVLVLAGVAALILVWDFFPAGKVLPRPRGKPLMFFALLGPVGAAAWTLALLATDERGPAFDASVVIDDMSFFFFLLFTSVTAAIILSSSDYARRFGNYESEFFSLVLFATSAMLLLSASNDLVLIFVALELTSISQYIMAALLKDGRSTEAGVKYLLMGATASAVILYGMAFLFGLTGTTRLADPAELSIAGVIGERGGEMGAGLLMATMFLVGGLGFKMAVVPFQMWAPDVYQGAPAPVAAFLSVASKAAGFAVILRIFFEGLPDDVISGDWSIIFAIVAAISMTAGNVMALAQTNIKRLLGYSSIAQAGNIAVGLAAISASDGGLSLGSSGVLFFIASYAFTNLGAFIVVTAISDRTESDEIATYAGLARRAPLLAAALALALISLTGIPPTAGFVAKLYVFSAAMSSDLEWLVVIAVLNGVISAFYYLRIARSMYLHEPASMDGIGTSVALKVALAVAVVGIIAVGIMPSPLLDAAKDAASVLANSR